MRFSSLNHDQFLDADTVFPDSMDYDMSLNYMQRDRRLYCVFNRDIVSYHTCYNDITEDCVYGREMTYSDFYRRIVSRCRYQIGTYPMMKFFESFLHQSMLTARDGDQEMNQLYNLQITVQKTGTERFSNDLEITGQYLNEADIEDSFYRIETDKQMYTATTHDESRKFSILDVHMDDAHHLVFVPLFGNWECCDSRFPRPHDEAFHPFTCFGTFMNNAGVTDTVDFFRPIIQAIVAFERDDTMKKLTLRTCIPQEQTATMSTFCICASFS